LDDHILAQCPHQVIDIPLHSAVQSVAAKSVAFGACVAMQWSCRCERL